MTQAPRKKDYGWIPAEKRFYSWEGKLSYEKALEAWNTRPRKVGRERNYPPHPTWGKYLALFDPSSHTRSQGAFCRHTGIRPAAFSSAKNKPITREMSELIRDWEKSLGCPECGGDNREREDYFYPTCRDCVTRQQSMEHEN